MKLKTVRLRRSRPSVLSLALALMLTMLFVYMASLSSPGEEAADAASASTQGTADVRMEGLEAAFECEGRYDNLLEARVRAALCAQGGGAGLILSDGSQFAVVRSAVSPSDAPADAIRRAAGGLTLRLTGPASEIAAVSDAIAFLRAQASETGSLANALESGDTDADSIRALLNVYKTQGERSLSALRRIENPDSTVQQLISACEAALARIDSAASGPDAGKIKLIHAAACAEWISMLEDLVSSSM